MRILAAHGPRLALLALMVVPGCATPDPAQQVDADRRARAHYGLAMEYLREGRLALSIRELEAAEQIDSDDPWIQLALGETYRQRGMEEEAETHLDNALRLRPGFQPALLNLSALYIQGERYEEAVEVADRLLDDATFPVPWKALTNRGYAQMKLGRVAEARQSLELALEYNDVFWPAILDIAILDADAGRHLEALEGLEHVLRLDPGQLAEAEVHYRMGVVYISLGNRERAMHHLQVATQSKPSGQWGKRSEDYLKRLR
jgi:Tfp pilus assembly protein PilF